MLTKAESQRTMQNFLADEYLLTWLAARGEHALPMFLAVKGKSKSNPLSTRSIRRIVKTAFSGVGFQGKIKTTHVLRHMAITNAIRNGAPIQEVRAMPYMPALKPP